MDDAEDWIRGAVRSVAVNVSRSALASPIIVCVLRRRCFVYLCVDCRLSQGMCCICGNNDPNEQCCTFCVFHSLVSIGA